MLSDTIRRLTALCALSALCMPLLPEKFRRLLSLMSGLLCADAILRWALAWSL